MQTSMLYRLTEAREMRGLSVAELAEMLDVSRQTIYKYENCTIAPPAEMVDKIIDKLEFPLPFLTTKASVGQSSNQVIHFRDMKTNTAKSRNMARNWLLASYELLSIFERYLELPDVNLPNIEIKDFRTLSDEMVDAIAEKTRRYWKLGDGPISDITLLLENNGIVVVRKPMDAEKLDACSVLLYGRPCILVKEQNDSCARDILNLAHELGHLVIHQSVTAEDMANKDTFNLIEQQAWRFASSFLLPPAVFRKELGYPSFSQYLLLKRRWRVSIQSMIMHSHRLGIIDDEKKQYFFREMTRRNIRKEEPLDDEIPVESNAFLFECARIIEQEDISTRDELHQLSNLSVEDYCQIIKAPKDYLKPKRQQPRLRIVN